MKLLNKDIRAGLLANLHRYPEVDPCEKNTAIVFKQGTFILRCLPTQKAIQSLADKYKRQVNIKTKQTNPAWRPSLKRQGNLAELGTFED